MTLLTKQIHRFAVIVTVTALANGALAAPSCAQLFRTAATEGVPSQQAVRDLQDLLTQDLRQQSLKLEKEIRSRGNQIAVDTLVIGSGLHGAIFAANAGKNNRLKDVLVIDAGSVVSKVFGEMAGSFRINSIELENQSANVFPGSPLKMKDLTAAPFATSLNMAAMGSGAMYGSAVPVLFNNKALEIVDLHSINKKNSQHYMVRTSQGVSIKVNKIVFATGLGEPSIPMKDVNTRKEIETSLAASEAEPLKIFPIMTVDAFLRMTALGDKKSAKDLTKELQGKTIAVVGKGDGGKIVIEALMNKGPHMFLKFPNLQVKWLGQEATTPTQYRESTWSRYHTIADNMGREIEAVAGYVEQVRTLEDGKIQITYDEGKITTADYILMATGYKSTVPDLLSHINGDGAVHSVTLEPLLENKKVIASRAVVDGDANTQIYVTGPAAGKIATPEEVAASLTRNPVSVAVLGPFTQALANQLVPSSGKINLLSGNNVSAATHRVLKNDRKLPLDARTLPLLLKMELQRTLSEFSTQASEVICEVSPSSAAVTIKPRGLDAKSAQLLLARMGENSKLIQILGAITRTDGAFSFKIPTANQELLFAETALEVR